MKHKKKIAFIFLMPLFIFGASALVMLLWNYSLSPVLGISTLTIWQAGAILILSRMLFGGFKFGPGRHRGGPPWKNKWRNMSEDDRKKFRENWKQRCEDRSKSSSE